MSPSFSREVSSSHQWNSSYTMQELNSQRKSACARACAAAASLSCDAAAAGASLALRHGAFFSEIWNAALSPSFARDDIAPNACTHPTQSTLQEYVLQIQG